MPSTKMNHVVTNTTVVVNFAAIGRLDLLQHLFGTVALPLEVATELEAGRDDGYAFLQDLERFIAPPTADGWLHLVTMTTSELAFFAALPTSLHRGERAGMTLAYHRRWIFLSDDRAARATARRYGIVFSGSIGCLVRTVERGLIALSEANVLLAAMIVQGYYAPVTDLTPLIAPSSSP